MMILSKKTLLLIVFVTAGTILYFSLQKSEESIPAYDWRPQTIQEKITTYSYSHYPYQNNDTFTVLSEPQTRTRQIILNPGQQFSISLSQTRWTRDTWGIPSYNDAFVKCIKYDKTENEQDNSSYVPQTCTWWFQTLKPGTSIVTVHYGNRWLNEPRQTNVYLITVE